MPACISRAEVSGGVDIVCLRLGLVYSYIISHTHVHTYTHTHIHTPSIHTVMHKAYGRDFYSGDEDNGEMGAWYVLAALGLYEPAPGVCSFLFCSEGCSCFSFSCFFVLKVCFCIFLFCVLQARM